MTCRAGLHIEGHDITAVTIRAFERVPLRFELVRRERVSRYLMRELPPFHLCEQCSRTMVLGVAFAAGRRRIHRIHSPVRSRNILLLCGNIGVTEHTAIVHCL